MKQIIRRILWMLTLLLFALPHPWITSASAEALGRTADPITVAADRFTEFIGLPISSLGLFKYIKGGVQPVPFQPVPFQIDEKTKDGDWVFPYGAEADPEAGNQLFNGNDELVFMARDVGTRRPETEKLSGAAKSAEICVNDPNGGAGYVYLAHFPSSPPPRSTRDYASYDPQKKAITTDYYQVGFYPDFPLSINRLETLPTAGGDGSSYVDRMKIRVNAKARFGIKINRHEEEFTSEDLAYIDGPVRVIRRTKNQMILFMSIPTPSAIMDNVYYREFFSVPSEVNIPFNVGIVLKEAALHTAIDLKPHSGRRVFYNSNNKNGVVIDGVMSKEEKRLDRSPFSWTAQAMTNPEKNIHIGWVKRLIVDPKVADFIKPELYYIDDMKQADPPESIKGHYGDIGFIINDLTGLQSGVYKLEILMYCVPGYEPGDEVKYLNILDAPLSVNVK